MQFPPVELFVCTCCYLEHFMYLVFDPLIVSPVLKASAENLLNFSTSSILVWLKVTAFCESTQLDGFVDNKTLNPSSVMMASRTKLNKSAENASQYLCEVSLHLFSTSRSS